jgi:hypothetical protein
MVNAVEGVWSFICGSLGDSRWCREAQFGLIFLIIEFPNFFSLAYQ